MRSDSRSKKVFSKVTTWTLRLVAAVSVLFFAAVILAANLGGKGESQRKALENVLSGMIGVPVKIHQLYAYQIFPTQRMDFQGLIGIEEDDVEPSFLVDRMVYVTRPLATWVGGLPIVALAFDNFMTRPGLFGPYSLHLAEGRIASSAEKEPAYFIMKGKYGEVPLTVSIPMEVQGQGLAARYRFDGEKPFLMKIAGWDVHFMLRVLPDRVEIKDAILTGHGRTIVADLSVPKADGVAALHMTEGELTVSAQIKTFGKTIEMSGVSDKKIQNLLHGVLDPVFVQGKSRPVTFGP